MKNDAWSYGRHDNDIKKMYGYLTSSGNMDGLLCSPRTENQDGYSGATLQNPQETPSVLR